VKVEILYVADCPSHPAAVRLVREVLAAQGVTAQIHEVLVTDRETADKLKFLGSPTIRVNGRDVANDQTQNFAMSCRLYPGSTQVGVPPAELIHRAIIEARRGST
jgi:Domain of unknown function (DUF2703)